LEDVIWIELAQRKYKSFFNTVMSFKVRKSREFMLNKCRLLKEHSAP